jgi:O-succinylbenzoate synthase
MAGNQAIYQVAVRRYDRPFRQPLTTHHGGWPGRQGLVVRLVDGDGRVGFGDIAPLAWMGSESLQAAIAFCRDHPQISAAQIDAIPDGLPATQFGLGMAREQMGQPRSPVPNWACCHLLPTGPAALAVRRESGQTYKWKIGVAAVAQELELLHQVIMTNPAGVRLRLDANGGLTWETAVMWLDTCDRLNAASAVPIIEFLEQPLPPSQATDLWRLSDRFTTPIALDESVARWEQLQAWQQQGWRGVMVVKAAIAGSPDKLRHWGQTPDLDLVWSSVFELPMTQRYIAERIVGPLPPSRAVGFGVNHWFADPEDDWMEMSQVWDTLPLI